MRLSDIGGQLLDDLSRQQGISKTSLVEIMLRDTARAKGVPIPDQLALPIVETGDYDDEWSDADLVAASSASQKYISHRLSSEGNARA